MNTKNGNNERKLMNGFGVHAIIKSINFIMYKYLYNSKLPSYEARNLLYMKIRISV